MATAAKPAESDIGVRRAMRSDAERFAGAAEHGEAVAQRLAALDQAERDWAYRLGQYELALNEHRSGTRAAKRLRQRVIASLTNANCCASMLRCRCAVGAAETKGRCAACRQNFAVLQVGINGIDTRTNGIADLIRLRPLSRFHPVPPRSSRAGWQSPRARSPRIQSPVRMVTSPMVMGCSKASGRQRGAMSAGLEAVEHREALFENEVGIAAATVNHVAQHALVLQRLGGQLAHQRDGLVVRLADLQRDPAGRA